MSIFDTLYVAAPPVNSPYASLAYTCPFVERVIVFPSCQLLLSELTSNVYPLKFVVTLTDTVPLVHPDGVDENVTLSSFTNVGISFTVTVATELSILFPATSYIFAFILYVPADKLSIVFVFVTEFVLPV